MDLDLYEPARLMNITSSFFNFQTAIPQLTTNHEGCRFYTCTLLSSTIFSFFTEQLLFSLIDCSHLICFHDCKHLSLANFMQSHLSFAPFHVAVVPSITCGPLCILLLHDIICVYYFRCSFRRQDLRLVSLYSVHYAQYSVLTQTETSGLLLFGVCTVQAV